MVVHCVKPSMRLHHHWVLEEGGKQVHHETLVLAKLSPGFLVLCNGDSPAAGGGRDSDKSRFTALFTKPPAP